jgi:hypothetical protein
MVADANRCDRRPSARENVTPSRCFPAWKFASGILTSTHRRAGCQQSDTTTLPGGVPIYATSRFASSAERWHPKVIAERNEHQFTLVQRPDHLTWHEHRAADEVFIRLDDEPRINFRDRAVARWIGPHLRCAEGHRGYPTRGERSQGSYRSSRAVFPLAVVPAAPPPRRTMCGSGCTLLDWTCNRGPRPCTTPARRS